MSAFESLYGGQCHLHVPFELSWFNETEFFNISNMLRRENAGLRAGLGLGVFNNSVIAFSTSFAI